MCKVHRLLIMASMVCSGNAFSQSNLSTVTNYSTGKAFTCIAVDTNRNVWAGTNKNGLYLLNKKSDASAAFNTVSASSQGTDVATFVMQSLAADGLGNVWLGHAGTGGTIYAGGGIDKIAIGTATVSKHYGPDRNAECFTFLQRDGLATLNTSSIAVDKNNTVWAAQRSHSLTSGSDFILTPGSLVSKRSGSEFFQAKSTWNDYKNGNEAQELPYPAYTCNVPISKTPGSRRCESVGCSNSEVWMSVYPYESTSDRDLPGREVTTTYLPARILRYDLDGGYLGQVTFDSVGATSGGVFNAIYLSSNSNAWVGLTASKGFAVKIKGCWTLINSTKLPTVLQAGASVNLNAIWGNNQGQVFIGTTKGLIVYNGVGKIDDAASYTVYTVSNGGIASDNVTGGANEKDSIQWVCTDNGISRIVSGNSFSLDKNYTSCQNSSINAIEAQAKEDQGGKQNWHAYEVVTYICDSKGPNKENCNAQYIYDMMKADASLTAPTPVDFPFNLDPFSPVLLAATALDLDYIHQRIFSSKTSIKDVALVYPANLLSTDRTQKIPFGNLLNSNKDYLALQKSFNPFAVEPCSRYRLYNNSTLIAGRIIYNKYIDNLICGDKLESMEYDPVWIYPDDKNLIITNYTAPGHFLNPGKIERRVIEECGRVKIITKGTGLQYCGDNLIGKVAGIGNVITGTILFHNIDIRLKTAFENK